MPSDSTSAGSIVPAQERLRTDAGASAGLSVLVSGLGQAVQRRWAPAFIHLGAVITYLVVVLQQGWGRAGWFAIAWNLWSCVDAYWHARRHASQRLPNVASKPEATPSSLGE